MASSQGITATLEVASNESVQFRLGALKGKTEAIDRGIESISNQGSFIPWVHRPPSRRRTDGLGQRSFARFNTCPDRPGVPPFRSGASPPRINTRPSTSTST
eukprot:scaffold1353_cov363-Pavlova_lutheri.AAC.18